MNHDIFITDFERTEYSDALHAILGRALIIATRFDSMCEAAAIVLDLKKDVTLATCMTEAQYNDYLQKLSSKYRTLNGNIESIGLPENISEILHDARKARNTVAHVLSKGLEGCLDTKIDEINFIKQVSELVMDIAHGDITISYTLSLFNGHPCPNSQYISSYKDRIVQWVVER